MVIGLGLSWSYHHQQEYMKTRVCSLGLFLLWVSVTAEFRDYIIFRADLKREMA